jgi:hypothetical protein
MITKQPTIRTPSSTKRTEMVRFVTPGSSLTDVKYGCWWEGSPQSRRARVTAEAASQLVKAPMTLQASRVGAFVSSGVSPARADSRRPGDGQTSSGSCLADPVLDDPATASPELVVARVEPCAERRYVFRADIDVFVQTPARRVLQSPVHRLLAWVVGARLRGHTTIHLTSKCREPRSGGPTIQSPVIDLGKSGMPGCVIIHDMT